MALQFDEKGNLTPYQNIEISYESFYQNFVENFPPNSTRHQIFAKFESFLTDFQSKIQQSFKIWANGSFVTKKQNPADIDFLVFVEYDWFTRNDQQIKDFAKSKEENSFLDVYFLIEYPKNHEHRILTESDIYYWQDWFSKTRKNRSGKSFSKGFVELKF